MADLETTPANAGVITEQAITGAGIAGESFAIGKICRTNGTKYYKADCTTLEGSGFGNDLVISASKSTGADTYFIFYKPGTRFYGGFTTGIRYFVGPSGDFRPAADLVSTNYLTYVGVGQSDGTLIFAPDASGVQVP